MPTYESSGSLTTIEKSYDSPQTPDLTGLVYTLNGESISVDVVGSPGEAGEETVTQSLGGATSYDLSWTSAHTSFEVVFNLSTADTSTSPEVDDLTLTGGPDAPTNLSVTEVTDTPDVSLSWSDNATTETEYRVYRSTSPGTTTGDYTLIDTLAADSTTYTDTSVSVGTRYYYRVTAANSQGQGVSSEVRAEVTDDFTNAVGWDSEREWGYGMFMPGTQPTGTGGVEIDLSGTHTFTYSIDSGTLNTNRARVEVRDATDSSTIQSAQVTGDTSETTASGEFVIDTSQYPDIELLALAESNGDSTTLYEASADITDEAGVGASAFSFGDGTVTDTYTDFYGVQTGTYETETWDYTNTTTASRLAATSTFNDASEEITVTVTIPGGATSQQTLTGGSEEFSVDIGPSDRYSLNVAFDAGDDATDGPVLESATLEAHTPPTNLQITSTDDTSNTVEWTGWNAADSYELYRSESTPVTTSDTLLTTTTNTTYTDSGLENGEAYYYNVRAVYTGE